MKVTSVSGMQSAIQRVIDIIGVTPEPADMKRYFSPGWRTKLKSPSGPKAFSRMPGFR
ncbi:hypothetical protein D3C78_1986230 [compost metagenome]